MCVTDRHDMTSVKAALNPNTTNDRIVQSVRKIILKNNAWKEMFICTLDPDSLDINELIYCHFIWTYGDIFPG